MAEPASSAVGGWIGVKIATAVFGFAGSVVSLAFVQQLTRSLALISVGVGLASSAALTPLIAHVAHVDGALENGVAFLIGLTAMSALPAIKAATAKWIMRKGDT